MVVAGCFIKLEFDMNIILKLVNPFVGDSYEKIKRTLVSIMIGQKDKNFESSQDPQGNAWTPLSQKTIAARAKGKKKGGVKILEDSGVLMKSLTVQGASGSVVSTEGNEVVLGTNIAYANIQNFGGVIVKSSLHEIKGSREPALMGVNVVIPARPFMGFGPQDNQEVNEYLEGVLKKANP
jgi:phage virion morphogenesis protein